MGDDTFFPDVKAKRKSPDDPWVNQKITDLIVKRAKHFRRCGEGNNVWKKLNKHTTRKLIKILKRKYYDFHGVSMMDPH